MDIHENHLLQTLVISDIKEGPKNFKVITFNGAQFSYKAGQYITLVDYSQGEEIRRSYSMASCPALNERLAIGVKRIENGYFSRLLIDRAVLGDKILTTGAAGFFVLPENLKDYGQVFFLAAGSGITPVYSLLKTCLHFHPHLQCLLVYSNPSADRAAFRADLLQLQQQFSETFSIEWLYSDSHDLKKARLYRELLIGFLEKFSEAPHEKTLFYICGPEAYMRMCVYILHEHKVPAANIKHENFAITRVKPPKAVPPDTRRHRVSISIGQETFDIEVQYPDTILSVAKKQDIHLPYSCETGKCGSCAAFCAEGKVWMSYNEVLTDKEINAGLVLTCVGYPVDGDVALEINSGKSGV